jgi:hypothetical protein
MNKKSINEIIIEKDKFIMNNTYFLNNNSNELNHTISYLKWDGFDIHYTEKEMDISIFIENKKKIDILNYLLNNRISIYSKLTVIPEKEKIYAPNLLGGGFFKDSDFVF